MQLRKLGPHRRNSERQTNVFPNCRVTSITDWPTGPYRVYRIYSQLFVSVPETFYKIPYHKISSSKQRQGFVFNFRPEVSIRAHGLTWGKEWLLQDWVKNLNASDLEETLLRRIYNTTNDFKDRYKTCAHAMQLSAKEKRTKFNRHS